MMPTPDIVGLVASSSQYAAAIYNATIHYVWAIVAIVIGCGAIAAIFGFVGGILERIEDFFAPDDVDFYSKKGVEYKINKQTGVMAPYRRYEGGRGKYKRVLYEPVGKMAESSVFEERSDM